VLNAQDLRGTQLPGRVPQFCPKTFFAFIQKFETSFVSLVFHNYLLQIFSHFIHISYFSIENQTEKPDF